MRVLPGALKDGQKIRAHISVRRKRVLHELTTVVLVDESGLIKAARVFADRFLVGTKHFNNIFKRRAIIFV